MERRARAVEVVGAVEIARHAQLHEHRVGGRPRRARGLQQLVLERFRKRELRVHAGGVRLEERAVLLGETRDRALGDRAQAEIDRLAVERHALGHDLPDFARGLAAREVHLQEAFARVDPALRAHGVGERLGADRRNLDRVEVDLGGRRERGERRADRLDLRRASVRTRRKRGDKREEHDRTAAAGGHGGECRFRRALGGRHRLG